MIDDLLSPARIEPLAPASGGAEDAWDEVCRRRRARNLRAQVAAGVGLVAVVMVGLLPSLDDGGRAAELDVAGRDTVQAERVETPSWPEADPEEATDLPVTDRPGRVTDPGRAPSPSAAAPAAQPRPGAQAPAPGRTKPPMERTRYENIYIGCLDWCMSPQVLRQDDAYSLTLDLCVAVGARARRFSFPTTLETDLWVTTTANSPDTLWTWSVGQQFTPQEHYVDIGPGECVTWQTLWDATDEQGARLEPGDYRLFAKLFAEQVAPNSTTETTFQISE